MTAGALSAADGWVIQGAITVTGLIGMLLNMNQDVRSYYWWTLTNLFLIYASVENNQWGGAALFLVYLALGFEAIRRWRRGTKSPA